jgi:hypothetical protein
VLDGIKTYDDIVGGVHLWEDEQRNAALQIGNINGNLLRNELRWVAIGKHDG